MTGDETCSITQYAANTSSWRILFPAEQYTLHGSDCGGSDPEIERTNTYYDNHPNLTDPVGIGDPTKTVAFTSASDTITTTAGYDPYGRVTSATDGNGKTTLTAYTPTLGMPTSVRVTNPLQHTTVTTLTADRSLPAAVTDPNGHVTTSTYDSAGRLAKVWLPTEPTAGPASYEFRLPGHQHRQRPQRGRHHPAGRGPRLWISPGVGAGVIPLGGCLSCLVRPLDGV